MNRVLITGPTGFIGRHCLQRLAVEDCEVHAVSRNAADATSRIHWHTADLRSSSEARDLIRAVRPSHILHLGWEVTPRVYSQSPQNLRWLHASLALVSAFGEIGGSRFVGAGTSAEYEYGHQRCIEDTTPIRPSSIYGMCKGACWLGVDATARVHGFSAAWGRIFLPYGPGDPGARLIPSVVTALREKRPIKTTDGRQLRDFIYAPDIADLLVRLLFLSEYGAFNIGSGRATSVRFVMKYIADRMEGRELLRLGAIDSAPGDPPVLVADMAKVNRVLGWSVRTSIEAGLDRTLSQSNGW